MFQRGKKVLRNVLAFMLILACVAGVMPGSVMETQAASADAPYQLDNPAYSYTTIDEATVTSTANGKPKVLVFFGTNCPNSVATLKDICRGSVDFSDADIVAVEIQDFGKKENVITFKNNYGSNKVTFAYSKDYSANSSAWAYLDKTEISKPLMPLTVYIDKNNKFQYMSSGHVTAAEVRNNIDQYCYGKDVSEVTFPKTTLQVNVEYRQAEARKMLSMVNSFRTGNDTWYWNETDTQKVQVGRQGALSYDYQLEQIAMKRAAEIAMSYSHTRPSGAGTESAFQEAGYFYSAGENIAAGTGSALDSAQKAFIAWREDNEKYAGQGHRRNMLESVFTAIGIGHVYYNGTHYWAMELGGTRTGTADPKIDGYRTVPVDVKNEDIRSLSVNNNTITIRPGESVSAPAVNVIVGSPDMWPPANASYFKSYPSGTASPSWSVGNASVAAFENGAFVGKADGSTTATATVAGKSVSITLKVSSSGSGNNGSGSSTPVFPDEVKAISVRQTKYNTLELNWPGAQGAKSYEIYYSTSPDGGFRRLANSKKTTYKFSKAQCGQTYYFKVRVCTKTGKSDFGPVSSGQTRLQGTSTVAVSKTTYNSVKIKWTKVAGAKKYEIYGYVNGSWRLLKIQGGSNYTHKGLQTGDTYAYKVVPVRDGYKGDESNEVSATTVLGNVSRLKVRVAGEDRMKVSFRKVPGVDYYVILRADSPNGEYAEVARVKKPSYIDTGLQPATTYFYKVYAVAGSHETNVEGPAGQATKMPKGK